MRGVLLSLVCAAGLLTAAPKTSFAASAPAQAAISAPAAPVFAQQQPDKTIDINVTDSRVPSRWYRSPVWIAIGAMAVVIVLLLIVLIAKSGGGGTTIIKE